MSIKTRNWLTRVKTRLSRTSSLVSQTNSVRQESGFRLTPKPTDLSLSSNAHDTVFVNQHGDFLPVSIGDSLQKDRYVIAKKIGSGRESTVWLAKDRRRQDKIVAVKVLRASACHGDCSPELDMLWEVSYNERYSSHPGGDHVLPCINHFRHTGPRGVHHCFVMEPMGCTMQSQALMHRQGRIPILTVKTIARQLLGALDFLHKECGIIHCDLNAHNIVVDFAGRQSNLKKLMARRTYGRLSFQAGGIPKTQEVPTPRVSDMNEAIVKIIDFENACPVKQHKMKTIQAPMLRAPEVWVGAPWGTAVDIWSLGCLIIEWAQGFAPFAIEKRGGDKYLANGDEYLAKMVKILGRFPQSLLDQRDGINDHFDDELMERIPDVRPGSLPIKALVDGSTGNFRRPDDMTHLETSQFISFLRKMLQLDPKGRRSAASLLQDPWLKYHT